MQAQRIVFGISPGTRSIGIAVLKNERLINWNVKSFTGKWSKEKSKHIQNSLYSLIKYFQPTTIVLKKVDPVRSSVHLLNLVEQISIEARKKRLKVRCYSIYDLQEFCGKEGRNIQQSVADTAIELFPELKHEYLSERNSKRPYYSKMFEAVIAAKWYEKQER